MTLRLLRCFLMGSLVLALGCRKEQPKSGPAPTYPSYPAYGSGPVGSFNDEARSNTQIADEKLNLTLTADDGKTIQLAEYRNHKNVVLVFMRGFSGSLCPYCTAQTSRLIKQHPEFAKRNTQVLVVFPGSREHVPLFKQSVPEAGRFPFPLLLDVDYRAVNTLGIRADQAKPSTYVIDRTGKVRFAYVGAHRADRPSIKALLRELDSLPKLDPAVVP